MGDERIRHESLQNGLHKTQHSVNYVVYEERAFVNSSSRTDIFSCWSTANGMWVCMCFERISLQNIHAYTKRRINASESQPLLFRSRAVSVHLTHAPQRKSAFFEPIF